MERFNLTNLSLLCSVYAAAEKWRITRITLAIKNEFNTLIDQHPNPVSLYFIAVKQGWRAEAEHAARVIARTRVQHLYATEMENLPATVYYNLLQFCHNFSDKVAQILSAYAPSYRPVQDNLPDTESLNYAIFGDEVARLSDWISSVPCPHGETYGSCDYKKCLKTPLRRTSITDLLYQSKLWKQRYSELLSEVRLLFLTKPSHLQ